MCSIVLYCDESDDMQLQPLCQANDRIFKTIFEDYYSEDGNSDGYLIKCVLSLYTVTMLMTCNHNRFARPAIRSSA